MRSPWGKRSLSRVSDAGVGRDFTCWEGARGGPNSQSTLGMQQSNNEKVVCADFGFVKSNDGLQMGCVLCLLESIFLKL